MNLFVNNTYCIQLVAHTATQGYEQLESFLTLSNTVFQILSVSTTFTANGAGLPNPNDELYANGCNWDADPATLNYLSSLCLGDARGNITLPYGLTVARPSGSSRSGCGATSTVTHTLAAGIDTINLANGTVAGGSVAVPVMCTISVNVTASSTGTYVNQRTNPTGDLYIGTTDTGNYFPPATLIVTNAPTPPTCTAGVVLADWTFVNDSGSPSYLPAYVSPLVGSTSTSFVPSAGATSSINTIVGNTEANSWQGDGFTATVPTTSGAGSTSYYQFQLDTSRSNIVVDSSHPLTLNFSAWPMDTPGLPWANSSNNHAYAWVSTDGTTYNTNPIVAAGVSKTTFSNLSGTTTAKGTSNTYFRMNFDGTSKAGAVLELDDVQVTGCAVPAVPTVTKSFSPKMIASGTNSTLTVTLSNPNLTNPSVSPNPGILTGVALSDTLPIGMTIVGSPTNNCGGTFSSGNSGSPSTGAVSLSGVTLPAATISGSTVTNGTCTVVMTVTDSDAGPHTNISSPISFISNAVTVTNNGSTGIATDTLTEVLPLQISKLFTKNQILSSNGKSTIAFTLTNPNPSNDLTAVGFTDNLPSSPAAMTVASTPNITQSPANCPGLGASITATGGSIALSGGTLTAGTS